MGLRSCAFLPLIAPLLNVSFVACDAGDASAPTQAPELPDASEAPECGAHAARSPGTPSLAPDDASPVPSTPSAPLATKPTGEDASPPDSGAASLPYDSLLGIGCTGAAPAFAADVVPILGSCAAGEICHGTQLDYGGMVNATSQRDPCRPARVIVTPRDLGNSYLLNKLLGIDMCGMSSRMPLGEDYLLPAQIQTLADWICVGAPND